MADQEPNVHNKDAANDGFPVLRSRQVRTDANGFVCLNDIWAAAGADASRRPAEWRRTAGAKRLTGALAARIMGISHNWPSGLVTSSKGAKGLTYAHVVLALAYAEFLDPGLAVEVREVFLRYKAADASLADEILERASLEDNRHVAARALGRVARGKFTDVLQVHGVVQPYFAICTDTVYRTLLDKPASALKRSLGVPAGGSLRDAMSVTDLTAIAFAEALSADRIDAADCQGGPDCQRATSAASRSVKNVLETEQRARASVPVAANERSPDRAA